MKWYYSNPTVKQRIADHFCQRYHLKYCSNRERIAAILLQNLKLHLNY